MPTVEGYSSRGSTPEVRRKQCTNTEGVEGAPSLQYHPSSNSNNMARSDMQPKVGDDELIATDNRRGCSAGDVTMIEEIESGGSNANLKPVRPRQFRSRYIRKNRTCLYYGVVFIFGLAAGITTNYYYYRTQDIKKEIQQSSSPEKSPAEEGIFVNDRLNGQGKVTFADGDEERGVYIDGHFHGHGNVARPGGVVTEGNSVDDRLHEGKRTETSPEELANASAKASKRSSIGSKFSKGFSKSSKVFSKSSKATKKSKTITCRVCETFNNVTNTCDLCPDGQVDDQPNGCASCPDGQVRGNQNGTLCSACVNATEVCNGSSYGVEGKCKQCSTGEGRTVGIKALQMSACWAVLSHEHHLRSARRIENHGVVRLLRWWKGSRQKRKQQLQW